MVFSIIYDIISIKGRLPERGYEMYEEKDLLFFIEKLMDLDEYWSVNYYLRSMKKAPHGGIFHIYYPNVFLKHYPFQPWTFVTHEPENIPFFMQALVDKAVEIYNECDNIDFEELLQYCYNGDNWYIGFRLLHTKPEYQELNSKLHGTLLWSIFDNNMRITDFFDIETKYAVYSLILCLIHDKATTIKNLNEILCREKLKTPYNKYGLTKVQDIKFLRQGFQIDDLYYQYNLFLDTTIGSPLDTMPYTFRIITDEIENKDIFMRCDNNLSVPFNKKYSTATVDAQKYYGITVDFANIEAIINKEIIVHIHPELLHKIVIIIKPDIENGVNFYHIEVEELWNTDNFKDDIILATFIHAKYYPEKHTFTHIDFSINQYDIDTYKAKYAGAVNNTGIPVDKHCEIHYKIWCIEAEKIEISTWSKLVCATLDEPFREIFLETFKS